MVGGLVREVLVLEDRVWINTFEAKNPKVELAIEVKREPAAECIDMGDSIWWQQKNAYWTPVGKAFSDYRLERLGSSGVPRPHPAEVEKQYA